MSQLDAPIRRMFDATNRGDSDGFLDAFVDGATLDDWGRTFTRRDAIAGWDARENIGVNSHLEATSVERDGAEIRVGVAVTGGGYNGGGSMTFTLDGDRIATMVIRG